MGADERHPAARCTMPDRTEILRHLTLGDQGYLDGLVAARRTAAGAASGPAELDYVGEALVKLGALAATDGSDLTWQQTIAAALDAGLTPDEVVDAVVVLAPVIGATRVVAIAPKIALAIGFDVGADLEALA